MLDPRRPHHFATLSSAIRYLSRVIPHGPSEADELYRTIATLQQIRSTPVQSRESSLSK